MQSRRIRLELSESFGKVVEKILQGKPIQERLIADDIIKILEIDPKKDESGPEILGLKALMSMVASGAYETFAQTYFECLKTYAQT